MSKKMRSGLEWTTLILIGILFFFSRCYHLGILPFGLHADEAGLATNASFLLHNGTDRYFNSFPVLPINYGGTQSALYTYLTTIFFALFGQDAITIRMTAVLFSAFNLIFGYCISRILFPREQFFSILTALLLTICPYMVLNGRFGLDCNIMLGASTIFLFFLLLALTEHKTRFYFLAGVTGGFLLYTYAVSYVILVCFLVLTLLYVVVTGSFRLREWLFMGIPLFLLALPLLLTVMINQFDLPAIYIGPITLPRIPYYRNSEITDFSMENFVFFWRTVFFGDEFAYNTSPGFKQLYGKTLPLFCIGIIGLFYRLILSVKKRTFEPISLILFWIISICVFESHLMFLNSNKANSIYTSIILVSVYGSWLLYRGLLLLLEKFPHRKDFLKQWTTGIFCVLLTLSYLMSGYRFLRYYFTEYTAQTDPLPFFSRNIQEGIEYIESDPVLSKKMTYTSIWSVFYSAVMEVDPLSFDTEVEGTESGLWHFGSLPEIDPANNYLVPTNQFTEYEGELISAGFSKETFPGYTVYYYPQ